MADVAVDALLVLGLAAEAIACAGLVLARDAYARLHFLAPSTLGALLVVAAVLVREGPSLISTKALLVGAILLAAAPLLTHATARALRIAEHGDWRAGTDEPADR